MSVNTLPQSCEKLFGCMSSTREAGEGAQKSATLLALFFHHMTLSLFTPNYYP